MAQQLHPVWRPLLHCDCGCAIVDRACCVCASEIRSESGIESGSERATGKSDEGERQRERWRTQQQQERVQQSQRLEHPASFSTPICAWIVILSSLISTSIAIWIVCVISSSYRRARGDCCDDDPSCVCFSSSPFCVSCCGCCCVCDASCASFCDGDDRPRCCWMNHCRCRYCCYWRSCCCYSLSSSLSSQLCVRQLLPPSLSSVAVAPTREGYRPRRRTRRTSS